MIIDRLSDLAHKAANDGYITNTDFLTPAEQAKSRIWLKNQHVHHSFSGGVEGSSATVLCLSRIIPFIENTLVKVGSHNVSLNRVKLENINIPEPNVELIRVTAASPRLDRIAASAFGISRTQMADYIRQGAVMVNWLEETRPDFEIHSGMTISLRGCGRISIKQYDGLSRKNRHIFIVERPV